jgi:NADH-ubiquinone oxidoreductase B12 subunit family
MFPGLGIATVAFIAYVAADYVVHPTNVESLKQSALHEAQETASLAGLLKLGESKPAEPRDQ